MEDIADKSDSTGGLTGQLPATQYNNHKNEIQKVVEKSAQILNAAVTDQFPKAVFINAVGAATMEDSGTVNSVALSPKTGGSGLVVPDNYTQMDGATFIFYKASPNTAASVLVNMGQTGTELGTKNLKRSDGTSLLIGEVSGWCTIQWDQSGNQWLLLRNEPDTFIYAAVDTSVVAPKFANNLVVTDVPASDGTITINAPVFVGQKLHVIAVGSNLVKINGGNGFYANGVFITENTGGAHFISVIISGVLTWLALDEVTADYQDGAQRIKKSALGEMQILVDVAATSGVGATVNYYGSTAGNMYVATDTDNFSVPFTAVPKYLTGVFSTAVGIRLAVLSAISYNVQMISPTASTASAGTALFIGFY